MNTLLCFFFIFIRWVWLILSLIIFHCRSDSFLLLFLYVLLLFHLIWGTKDLYCQWKVPVIPKANHFKFLLILLPLLRILMLHEHISQLFVWRWTVYITDCFVWDESLVHEWVSILVFDFFLSLGRTITRFLPSTLCVLLLCLLLCKYDRANGCWPCRLLGKKSGIVSTTELANK